MVTLQSYDAAEHDPLPSIVLDKTHVLTANRIFGGIVSAGILMAFISISIGLLNAGSMSY